jgi:uncharacterized protein YndB with AHSA1/START domain
MKWVKWIAIVLAALIVLPAITLMIMGHRANAGTSHVALEINAAPDQVWTWLDDGDKLKQWISWMVDVKYPNPEKARAVGGKRVWTMRDENNGGAMMQLAGTFTEYTPPSLMTFQMADSEGLFNGETSYRLTDLGGGRTRMEVTMHAHYNQWFANLMEPVITPAAEKKLGMDVQSLKRLAEAQAAVH